MNIYEKAKSFGIEKDEIKILESGEFFLVLSAIQKIVAQADTDISSISETFEGVANGKACVSTEIVLKNGKKNKSFGICDVGGTGHDGELITEAKAIAIARGRSLRSALRWTNFNPNELLLEGTSSKFIDNFRTCQKSIHAIKHELKMSDEYYRSLLLAATGKRSTKEMTTQEIQLASARFISLKLHHV